MGKCRCTEEIFQDFIYIIIIIIEQCHIDENLAKYLFIIEILSLDVRIFEELYSKSSNKKCLAFVNTQHVLTRMS